MIFHQKAPLFILMLVCAGGPPAALALDLDGDGICDVWRARYHAAALDPDGDADADGASNRDEAAAGTDPFDPTCRLRAAIEKSGDDLRIDVTTQPGKRYQLLAAPSPGGPWSEHGTPVWSGGGELSLPAPTDGTVRFFRVRVQDADSDGDGVSDWAESQLAGYERENADSFGAEGGDQAGVREWLEALAGGQLSAAIISASATEKEGTPAVISYTRQGTLARPFTVFLKTLGPDNPARSAASAGDWIFKDAAGNLLSERLVIPAGQASADLHIHALADALSEVPEHLRVRVGGSSLDTAITLTDAANTAANQRLFVAYLRPLPGTASLGAGVATLRLPGDNDTATVTVSFSNLKSPVSSTQVQTENAAILQSVPPFNYGGQPWAIRASQFFLSDQAVLDALLGGGIHLGVFTETNVTGEIGGVFQITTGSTEFQAPPPAPALESLTGEALDRDIARFLTQASFGPAPQEIQALRDLVASHGGDRIAAYSAWIDGQFASHFPTLEAYARAANAQEAALNPELNLRQQNRRRGWWLLARHAPSQLRERMAFALSEIFVVSDIDTTIRNRAYGSSNYDDMLRGAAFGSYRTLLEGVSTHPIMGQFLSHLKNQKAVYDTQGNPVTSPDENYAREIMQLFSIGLVELHPDGSLKLGPDGLPIATYGQNDIAELARVFTGWSFSKRHAADTSVIDNNNFFQGNGALLLEASWTHPMKMFQAYHDTGAKSLLGLDIPAEQTGEQDLAMVLDHLAAHPNTAPFICRRLIQRLVTANPTPGYLHRVASAFTASGGNLGETVRAILLDPEARNPQFGYEIAGAGKVREPLLRYTAFLRAFDIRSELRLSDLTDYGYPAEELAAFPAGTTRVRMGDTDATLGQTPRDAPSVFNWFQPDYAPPGALSSNGLVSPELQIANENSTYTSTNFIYTLIFLNNGQNGEALPLQTEPPSTYTAISDNLILSFAPLRALYMGVLDVNGDGSFTAADNGTFNNAAAIRAACAAVLDHVDLMLCNGALKARYGESPGTPRDIILTGTEMLLRVNNSTNNAATQESVALNRMRHLLWLVATTPEAIVQK